MTLFRILSIVLTCSVLLAQETVTPLHTYGVREILFAVRKSGTDEHWYANFGYYADSCSNTPFPLGTGGKLQILHLETGSVRTIFEDPEGNIRDPQLHYDGNKIVFSYLPKGKRHYNLYELTLPDNQLRQITAGDWDDIEPTYTASGDIIFCSSRSKRWVQCWLTQVATLHRCTSDGKNIREISANIEQDNTPWMLPNGQVLYTRWEYVDRSQVDYHHLWTVNPDGTRHAAYYGNLHPATVMIDAKPIPNSKKIVASFSPGHGRTEHYGRIAVVDPSNGPDDASAAKLITKAADYADPWAFSEDCFIAARHNRIVIVDGAGKEKPLYVLPQESTDNGFQIHEPRPMMQRQRETLPADQTDPAKSFGRLALVNIYEGRQMQSVKKGSIKELLVLETLPEPIHYSGGMDQISSGGTFTLERIAGTIPVAKDGSVFMELPANRAFLFIAIDEQNRPVKRMHSFTNVMPGETTICIGCHEVRTEAPPSIQQSAVLSRQPLRPQTVKDIPEVFDFVRDIQPILDKHCIVCHNDTKSDGGVVLTGGWGPLYSHSYTMLSWRNCFGDNRNRAMSNFPPYAIGSSASKLFKLVNEKHGQAELSAHEKEMLRYYLETGAPYAGTYAANGTGLIGWHYRNQLVHTDKDWAEVNAMQDVLHRRCDHCHKNEGEDKNRTLPHRLTHSAPRYNRQIVFDFKDPESSWFLRAPLSQESGGRHRCSEVVFQDKNDPDYKILLTAIQKGHDYIVNDSNRFCMPVFHANESYTREMIRYGILPKDFDRRTTPLDPYETDKRYWESLWYRPH